MIADSNAIPIACDETAFRPGEAERCLALRRECEGRATAVRELPDGFAIDFETDAELFVLLAEWATLERRCCPFLTFGLTLPAVGAISLQLTGPEGAKDLLAREFVASLPASR